MNIKIILAMALSLCLLAIPAIAFSGSGAGNSTDPFQITNCTQLQEIGDNLGAYYNLMNDIDCSATSSWNAGAGFLPIGNDSATFGGYLNGTGHKITNLFINRPSMDNVGLFGRTNGGIIDQLGIEDANITGHNGVGILAGAPGNFYPYTEGYIYQIYTTGKVQGNDNVGGIMGVFDWHIWLYNSYTTANVTCVGLCGGAISYIYNTGYPNEVRNIYSVGFVSGGNTTDRGLCGGYLGGIPIDSYWNLNTSGQTASCNNGAQYGRTTAQMKTQGTYNQWDFVNIWQLCNDSYPTLRVFGGCPVPCVPSWNCSGYGDCLQNDSQLCNAVIDNNICNESYAGNYSEFPPAQCNYCTPDWVCTLTGNCTEGVLPCLSVTDLNICNESFEGNVSTYDDTCQQNETGYVPQYGISDFRGITGDIVGTTFSQVISQMGFIILAFVIGFGIMIIAKHKR